MPFDPNIPQAGTEIDAVQMRSQLNGLKSLIDAVPAGPPGPEGPVGTPGEVTTAALDAAISGTSNNSNAVTMLGETADISYNQPQMQALMNKMDELINALRR